MAAEKGMALLLKAGAVLSTPVTIGCQRSLTITVNNEQVDITNKDSLGIRDLLEGAGVQSTSLSMSGVFDGDAGFTTLQTAALANTIDTWSMFFGDGSTWEFLAAVASFEQGGEHNGEQTYSVTFEVSGAITVA